MGITTTAGAGQAMIGTMPQVGAPGAPTTNDDELYPEECTVPGPNATLDILFRAVADCREDLVDRRPAPNTLDCLLFAMTELAEYVEASRLRTNGRYVRNNERHFDPQRELAQVGEMLLSALWQLPQEPRSQDAGGALIGVLAMSIGQALLAQGRGERSIAERATERATNMWIALCGYTGEDAEALLRTELGRIRAKFGEVGGCTN
jgi:hypothetical protein